MWGRCFVCFPTHLLLPICSFSKNDGGESNPIARVADQEDHQRRLRCGQSFSKGTTSYSLFLSAVTEYPVAALPPKSLSLSDEQAVLSVAAATQVFLTYLAQHAFQQTKLEKRKTVAYKDLSRCFLRCIMV